MSPHSVFLQQVERWIVAGRDKRKDMSAPIRLITAQRVATIKADTSLSQDQRDALIEQTVGEAAQRVAHFMPQWEGVLLVQPMEGDQLPLS